MVKSESMSNEEKIQNEKFETLVNIAREICGEEKVVNMAPMLSIRSNDKRGDLNEYIIANTNTIRIYSLNNFNIAVKLAQEYEKRVGEKITVKKE